MEKNAALENHSVVKCPHCQKEIVLVWFKPSVLTVEAFQREIKEIIREVA